jgi:hypothetical protein
LRSYLVTQNVVPLSEELELVGNKWKLTAAGSMAFLCVEWTGKPIPFWTSPLRTSDTLPAAQDLCINLQVATCSTTYIQYLMYVCSYVCKSTAF